MSSVIVTAAGNDITATSEGYSDSQRLGLFVIYDFVRWLRSVMFHCKNNKTMCQKDPARRAGRLGKEFVIDGLCVSQDALCSWPLGVSDQSLWLRCLEAELLWWLQIYGDALLIAPKGAGGRGGRMRSFSRGIAQFIPRQGSWECFFTSKGGRIRSEKQWILHLFRFRGRVTVWWI